MSEFGSNLSHSPIQNWMISSEVMRKQDLRKFKKLGKKAQGLTDKAKAGAEIGLGIGVLGGALNPGAQAGTAAGQAGSAAATALPIAGGVLALATMAVNGRSVYKTNKHIKRLEYILENARHYDCSEKGSDAHSVIISTVLPYIIRQKKNKRLRKAGSALPVLGALEGVRAAGKKGWKFVKGTLGKERSLKAEQLAAHHCSCDCQLTEEIIAQIANVSIAEAKKASYMDYTILAYALSEKMRST